MQPCDDKSFKTFGQKFWENIDPKDWNDANWQLKNRINSLEKLETLMELTAEERAGVLLSGSKLAMAITPYFFTLIDTKDPNCPIRKQVIPRFAESQTDADEMDDPCGEDGDMVVPGLVHRYPDRVLFLVTDRCASYCRYCTRSRVVSGVGEHHMSFQWEEAFRYIENHSEVRDVLLSGGDALLLSEDKLEKILSRLRAIPHVEFLRIGTRVPIFLPQRIQENLAKMLRKYAPLFISVHVNHPRELTTEARDALGILVDHGIVIGSQSVLLRGVNDDLQTQKNLMHKLLMSRVRPYYLYQCDLIRGSGHFRTSIQQGIDIIEGLRGHTTGYAVPTYVIDGPGGGGKIPLQPDYIQKESSQGVILRNFQHKEFVYPNPQNQ